MGVKMGLAGVGPSKTQNEAFISTMNHDQENGEMNHLQMQFAYADNSELGSYIETNEDPT